MVYEGEKGAACVPPGQNKAQGSCTKCRKYVPLIFNIKAADEYYWWENEVRSCWSHEIVVTATGAALTSISFLVLFVLLRCSI